MFSESDKFYIVIREWLYISFVEIFLVICHKLFYPRTFVCTTYRVGRISNYYHHRLISFYLISILPLSCYTLSKSKECPLSFTIRLCFFERVSEIDLEALIEFRDTGFCKRESELQMCDSVARHHQLKSVQSWDKVVLDIRWPDTCLILHARMNMSDNFIEKCACPCGRVKNLHTMNFFSD